ncbi:efflux RND transporter permease subunit [Oceanibacterium hippocampi]|uniref:Multidrug resistance protein MexB n=1 Tax=Oceanibacterium hippocampi TaxID=745714 RepID=A0A1Y5RYR7_9PROT|nr:efflux RND transporter permease subunit [Oceanibacterium hippocampi]SLN25641.1 Multidrug resistance protein MexB [Oceanibacterium hippocampi]
MNPLSVVRLFVHHRTAANLLMILMIVAGLFALLRLNTQFFPTFSIDIVSVTVPWPGASAADVDGNIIAAIEPEVRFLDSVRKVTSYAAEGQGTVVIEFEPGSDMQAALSDVEQAVARVTTLPDESERPIIKRVIAYDTIARLVVSGPFSESALKSFAKEIRDELLDRGIDKIDLVGARDEEIWIEIDEGELRRLDLTLDDVGRRVGSISQDLPLGTVGGPVEKQLRSLGEVEAADLLGAVEIRSGPTGERVLLRDVARMSEAFDKDAPVARRLHDPAIELHIRRASATDALVAQRTMQDYMAEKAGTWPETLRVEMFDVMANLIRDRIELLLRNGVSGLILVLGVLFVFLNGWVAFWVAAGIPVAMLATAAVMLATGQSINMVSLFAMIMTLGVIVDDAIVVAEHGSSRRALGLSPGEAAEEGATRMLAPVVASSLTTIATFLPILLVSDIIGQIIAAIPYVVVATLIASLVECFLILPGHMRHALSGQGLRDSRLRQWFNRHFDAFRDGPFVRAVGFVVRWRYASAAGALGLLIVAAGLIVGGRVPFTFFPSPESDTVNANILFAPGTPRETTTAMIEELERALHVAEEKLTDGAGGLVLMAFGKSGISQGDDFSSVRGGNRGGVHVELAPSDHRDIRTAEFIEAWRAEIRPLPGLQRLALIERSGGPPGREVDIRLSGASSDVLKQAAEAVKDALGRYPGISDIEDDLPYGKQELLLELTPRGLALGFTTDSVSRQVRAAFEGTIARKFARGDEEVTIRLKYPREQATLAAMDRLYLKSPTGAEVPLTEAVRFNERIGFDRIRREDGHREVAVTAEVDEDRADANQVLASLAADDLPRIAGDLGIDYSFAGKAEEQERTFGDMKFGAMIGLAAIYIILAWVFSSYGRPFVVMSIIPFGFVGAVVGHMVLGYAVTVLSLVALLGLAGILVNDSIILVSTIDERISRGERVRDAIVQGTADRLRAVLLTSLTTIGGLAPLLFETSLQARFLIPMAITMVFGLMTATLLVLFLVPALTHIAEDIGGLFRGARVARRQPDAGRAA